MTPEHPMGTVVVGLDIGGTKTHGVKWRDGKVIGDAKSGSANVQNVSVAAARENIAQVFSLLGDGPIDSVVAGAGGIDTAQDAERLREMIAVHASGARIRVVHDSRLILAAGHAETGMAVILGTGSAVWGVDSTGKEARAGGWGYLLGDEASGYWMGREAVRHTLRAANREQPAGVLTRLVLEANNVASAEELIGLFHGGADRRHWAQQSPLVFSAAAAGDPEAIEIINAAVGYVVDALGDVSKVLGLQHPVIIGGGLGMHQPMYQQLLLDALEASGLRDIQFLEKDPVFGVPFIEGFRAS